MKKLSQNIISFFSLFLLLTAFSACSNSQESKLVYNTESDTIKQAVKDKELVITWTQELEEKRLSETINRSSIELGNDVPYNPEVFKIDVNRQTPVFPSLGEFGSLDTRNISAQVKDKLNKFCEAFASEKHEGADNYFNRKYIFNYVFFVQDLEEGWKKAFNSDYTKEKEPFSKWIYGEPFIGSEIMQIPVRFYTTCGIIDVTMLLNSNGSNEIYQITIDRWQKYDGTR